MTIIEARKIVQRQAGFEEQSRRYYENDATIRRQVDEAYKAEYPGTVNINDGIIEN